MGRLRRGRSGAPAGGGGFRYWPGYAGVPVMAQMARGAWAFPLTSQSELLKEGWHSMSQTRQWVQTWSPQARKTQGACLATLADVFFVALRDFFLFLEDCVLRRPRCHANYTADIDRELAAHNAPRTRIAARDPVSYFGRVLGYKCGLFLSPPSQLTSQAPLAEMRTPTRTCEVREPAPNPASAAWCSTTT